MIREELSRIFKIEERHRRLLARLVLAFGLSILVYAAGAVLTWVFESGQKGGDIKGFGDAAFFAAVQLLTVSSQIKNPLTVAGRIVDVGLEVWAIFVVTVVAGSFATFFSSGDSSWSQGTSRRSSRPSTCPSQEYTRIRFLPTIVRPIHRTGSGQSMGDPFRHRQTRRAGWRNPAPGSGASGPDQSPPPRLAR